MVRSTPAKTFDRRKEPSTKDSPQALTHSPFIDRARAVHNLQGAAGNYAINRTLDRTEDYEAPPIVHDVLNSGGQPLDLGTRRFMESRFDEDFSQIRIHTDQKAAYSAQILGAKAYAAGQDIAFAAGTYQPDSILGQKLIAHELTHTLQQNGKQPIGERIAVSTAQEAVENQARHTGHQLHSTGMGPVSPIAAPYSVQMSPESEGGTGYRPGAPTIEDLINSFRRETGLDLERLAQRLAQQVEYGEYTVAQQVLRTLVARGENAPRLAVILVKELSDQALKIMISPGNSEGVHLSDFLYSILHTELPDSEELTQSRRIAEARATMLPGYRNAEGKPRTLVIPYRSGLASSVTPEVEALPGKRIHVRYPVRALDPDRQEDSTLIALGITTDGIEFLEDEIIGIRDYDQNGRVYHVPASYLLRLARAHRRSTAAAITLAAIPVVALTILLVPEVVAGLEALSAGAEVGLNSLTLEGLLAVGRAGAIGARISTFVFSNPLTSQAIAVFGLHQIVTIHQVGGLKNYLEALSDPQFLLGEAYSILEFQFHVQGLGEGGSKPYTTRTKVLEATPSELKVQVVQPPAPTGTSAEPSIRVPSTTQRPQAPTTKQPGASLTESRAEGLPSDLQTQQKRVLPPKTAPSEPLPTAPTGSVLEQTQAGPTRPPAGETGSGEQAGWQPIDWLVGPGPARNESPYLPVGPAHNDSPDQPTPPRAASAAQAPAVQYVEEVSQAPGTYGPPPVRGPGRSSGLKVVGNEPPTTTASGSGNQPPTNAPGSPVGGVKSSGPTTSGKPGGGTGKLATSSVALLPPSPTPGKVAAGQKAAPPAGSSPKSANLGSSSALVDVSQQYDFFESTGSNGVKYKTGRGWLGVPGTVVKHRSSSAQTNVSSGTGEDAGHLIGNRFGAPGDERNLSLQNWRANQYGSFKKLENMWAAKLKAGFKIHVEVTDITRPGENRPYPRKVSWKEVAPDNTSTENTLDFVNFHTTKSRAKQNVPSTTSGSNDAEVIELDFKEK